MWKKNSKGKHVKLALLNFTLQDVTYTGIFHTANHIEIKNPVKIPGEFKFYK